MYTQLLNILHFMMNQYKRWKIILEQDIVTVTVIISSSISFIMCISVNIILCQNHKLWNIYQINQINKWWTWLLFPFSRRKYWVLQSFFSHRNYMYMLTISALLNTIQYKCTICYTRDDRKLCGGISKFAHFLIQLLYILHNLVLR